MKDKVKNFITENIDSVTPILFTIVNTGFLIREFFFVETNWTFVSILLFFQLIIQAFGDRSIVGKYRHLIDLYSKEIDLYKEIIDHYMEKDKKDE